MITNQNKYNFINIGLITILTIVGLFSITNYAYNSFKPIVLLYSPLLIILNYYAIKAIKNDYSHIKSVYKIIISFLLHFIFGTLLVKSFIIYIYPFARMSSYMKVILFGFGFSIIGTSIVYTLEYLFRKIKWQSHKYRPQPIKAYLKFTIPSLVILGIIFTIYYPGLGSGDTVYVWDMIAQNKYTDTHPLMFLLLYKGLSLLWNNIAVITVFQYLTSTLVFGYVAYYFSGKGLKSFWCYFIAVALALLPVNALYTITLWKDIPYSIGLLLFIILTIKVLEDDYFKKIINIVIFIITGLFVMFMRHNGFIPVLGCVGLLWLYNASKKHWLTMAKLMFIGVSLIVLFYSVKTGAGIMLNRQSNKAIPQTKTETISNDKKEKAYDEKTIIPPGFPTTVAVSQLIYVQDRSEFTDQQQERFEEYLKLEELEQHKFDFRMGNKYGANWEFYYKPYLYQKGAAVNNPDEFWNYYAEIMLSNPIVALESYQKMTSILWASVGYGPTAYRGKTVDEFSIYVNEDYANFMSPAKNFLDNTIFGIYPNSMLIFNRPAIYLMIILLMCFVGYRQRKIKIIIIFSSVFLNIAGYLIIITAQDVRYCYINMLVFIIAFVYATMKPSIDVKKETSDFAFVCETPLHTFNAINFVSNNIEDSKMNSDIYIYQSFNGSHELSENLKKENLFRNIYDISKYNEDVDRFTKFRNLFRLFFPKTALKAQLLDKEEFCTKNYKYLALYSFTMRSRHFLASFTKADVIMIEDGMGAYLGNQMKDHVDGYYKLLDKYVFRKKYDCNPVRLYVYQPSICHSEINDNPLQLPNINMDNPAFDLSFKIYDYTENDEYVDKRLVYFTQPLNLLQAKFIENSDKKIIETLDKLSIKDQLITRVHPRQSCIDLFGSDYDKFGNFWEIESAKSITEKHILISAFSTAACTPKYINNIEPYIIFTYKLSFIIQDTPYWNNLQAFIQTFIETYTDKTRISIPETFEEYEKTLKEYMN